MLVAAVAQDAEFLQAALEFLPGNRGRGHPVAKRAVGVADAEARHGLRMEAFPFGQILHGLRVIQKRAVIEVGDDPHQGGVVHAFAGICQNVVGGAGVGLDGGGFGCQAEAGGELVGGPAETDVFQTHQQLDGVAATASGQTVPEVLAGRNDKRRLAVLVERAAGQQVFAAA